MRRGSISLLEHPTVYEPLEASLPQRSGDGGSATSPASPSSRRSAFGSLSSPPPSPSAAGVVMRPKKTSVVASTAQWLSGRWSVCTADPSTTSIHTMMSGNTQSASLLFGAGRGLGPDHEVRKARLSAISAIDSKQQALEHLLEGVFMPDVLATYRFEKVLGHGAFGTVFLVHDRETGDQLALKAIQKRRVKSQESLRNELSALRRVYHRNVTKLHRHLEDDNYMYIGLEFCPGGELLDKLIEQGNFAEPDAAYVLEQVLKGMAYLHSKQVVHRDLKPDNVLLMDKDDLHAGIRISDFGVAQLFPEHPHMQRVGILSPKARKKTADVPTTPAKSPLNPERVGTPNQLSVPVPVSGCSTPVSAHSSRTDGSVSPSIMMLASPSPFDVIESTGITGTLQYMSPELLKGQSYTYSVDMWAVGVLLFNLFSGDYPWDNDNEETLAKLIVKAELDLSHPGWRGISAEGKDLLRQLLEPNPAKRLSAKEALAHEWIVQHRSKRQEERHRQEEQLRAEAAAREAAAREAVTTEQSRKRDTLRHSIMMHTISASLCGDLDALSLERLAEAETLQEEKDAAAAAAAARLEAAEAVAARVVVLPRRAASTSDIHV